MELTGKTIGFAMTGSFCTFKKTVEQIKTLVEAGANVLPIMSFVSASTDTRFGRASDFITTIEGMTGHAIIKTIKDAEPFGPKKPLDAVVVAPCTGNTLGKLSQGICDTPVTMTVKSSLRNERPIIIAVSTNDGLGASAKNIGLLLNSKHYYFVPFRQDDPEKKPRSLVADFSLIPETVEQALEGKQIQPIVRML